METGLKSRGPRIGICLQSLWVACKVPLDSCHQFPDVGPSMQTLLTTHLP